MGNVKAKNRRMSTDQMRPRSDTAERWKEMQRAFVRKKLLQSGQPLTPEQLDERVLVLSDSGRMKEQCFGSVLRGMDDAVAAVADEREARAQGIRNRNERQVCIERMATEFDSIQNVEVKLVLCQLKRELLQSVFGAMYRYVNLKRFDYGPYHVALIVGNVVLDWDNTSLVIPRLVSAEDNWIFEGNVHQSVVGSDSFFTDLSLRAGPERTGQQFDTIVEQLTNIKMEKEQLVHELVAVAVQYNTKHTYGFFSNNCQHFVRDCLHVMGVRDKDELFDGRLRDHAAVLMKEGLKGCEEFNSHQDLDEYVRENLQNMNQSELEFCLCHYLLFHAFHKASPKEAWQCQEDTCLQSHVEKRLQDSKRIELD